MDKRNGQAGAGNSCSLHPDADRTSFTENAANGENARNDADVLVFLPGVVQAAQEDRDVERVNHYPLYELGKTFRSLAQFLDEEDIPVRSMHSALLRSLRVIDRLLGGEPLPLGISKGVTGELRGEIGKVYDEYFMKKDKEGKLKFEFPSEDITISSWEMYGIKTRIEKFETLFSTEMGEAATYYVPSRGIYSTAALIDYADQTFPPDIFGHVPDKAKADWRAAGRCLAFSLLSATGFHVARAVEATLEVYYQLYTGKTKTLKGWHDYIQALEGVRTSGAEPAPADKTLAELRQMKDDYRNPIMHPRVILTENDARMLFDNGESLIIAMAEEIKAIRANSGVQGALAVVGGSALDEEIPF